MEGFLTPSSPRPKVSPESPAEQQTQKASSDHWEQWWCRICGGEEVCRHPLPYAYFWEAVSKEIKSFMLLTGAKSHQPGPQLSLPRMTPTLERLRGPLWGERVVLAMS